MEWNRPMIVELIKAIKARPAIWDTHNKEYRDKYKRRQCFGEISQAFQCPRTDIEKKIANLRTQYGREVTKIAKCRASGDNVYESKWFAFKLLSFLKPKIGQNSTIATDGTVCTVSKIYKRKSDKQSWGKQAMIEAVAEVVNYNKSVNSVAKKCGIPEPTLRRYLKKSCRARELEEKDSDLCSSPRDKEVEDIADYVHVDLKEESATDEEMSLEIEDGSGCLSSEDITIAQPQCPTLAEEQPCIVESTSPRIVHSVGDVGKNGQFSQKFLKFSTNTKCESKNSVKDEFDMFGQSVAAQLRNIIDPYARSMAKFNIQKALFEAETGVYTTEYVASN